MERNLDELDRALLGVMRELLQRAPCLSPTEMTFLALMNIARTQREMLDALTGLRASAASMSDVWASRWEDRA